MSILQRIFSYGPTCSTRSTTLIATGDADGSREGLDKDVIVATWNFRAIESSLKWFASRGHRQVMAAYFDHDISEIGEWVKAAASLPGVSGAVYMTWRQDYSPLGRFADLMWNGRD